MRISDWSSDVCSSDLADHSISDEFRTLSAAAAKVEIAPGIELGRAFWTHAQALHSKRLYASLREIARRWPRGHAPQAFLALFAHEFRGATRSEEHTSELQSLMRISYAVFCLKKKIQSKTT